LKRRDDADVSTLRSLALAVGLRLALIPLDEGKGDPVFFRGQACCGEGRRAAAGRGAHGQRTRSARACTGANAFISFAPTEVELKAIDGGRTPR